MDDGYTLTDAESGRVHHFADNGTDVVPLSQTTDRNGNWITFDHDSAGRPVSVHHHGGYRITLAHVDGRLTALSLATGAGNDEEQVVRRYEYSPQGDLTAVFDSTGRPTRFGYDGEHRITSWTDTKGQSFGYVYDDRDRCVRQGGEAGHEQSEFSYALSPEDGTRTTTITDSFGNRTRFRINDRSQVIAETTPLGATTRYVYDRYNRLLQHTDPLGRTMAFTYDEAGHLVTVTRPDGRTAHAEYNAFGQPTKVVDPDGTITRHTYDARGNHTSTTGRAGHTTQHLHDATGRPVSVTDRQGRTTTLVNDPAGLVVEVTDPSGAVTRYERDAFGRITAVEDPDGATSRVEWTVEGRLARHTAPNGSVERWTYDGEGNCTGHTDSRGCVSSSEYTHFDLLTARTGPDGARLEFRHDTELRLTGVTNAQGQSWSYEYDADGNLSAETDFDGRRLDYTHDAAGNLTSRTNAMGQVIRFEYNFLGQVTRKDANGQVTEFSYDLTDQLAGATDPHTSLTLLRDQFGRLHSETVDGRTLKYTYDENGRLKGRRTPTGAETRWRYDEADRTVQMLVNGHPVDFTYDAVGREASRRVGTCLALSHTFEPTGRLTAQTMTTADGEQRVRQRRYAYHADGLLIGIEDSAGGSCRVDLDAAGRVTAVSATGWSERYAYDSSGNQTHARWPRTHPGHETAGARSYDGTQLTRAGTTRYEYDAMGRMTLRQKYRLSRKPETWRFEWDVEDRIVGVVTPDSTRWRYTYDPLGRRTSKARLADDSDTVVERTPFTWDGATLCEQLTDSPDLPGPVALTWDHQGMHPLTQTERILGGDSPQETVDSRFFAIVTDLIGTPSELVDEQGDIAWQARSTVWGTTSWARGSSTYTPLRFPGQYFDPETGLHYNHFRHYDPETARYVSPDPLGLAAAPNSVAYVHNPHLWVDPFGLTPCKDAAKNAKDKQTTPLGKEFPTREEGSVGSTADHKYKRTFFNEHPELKGKVVVHHAIEQQVLKRYPGLFSADEIHSLENLRGIPKGDINSKVHLSDIRVSWNEFYRTHSNPARQDVLDHVTHVDDKLGNWFSPRIR
ncbi:RHS repeat-associated core domain-containing protein [Streptomyces sp. NPDC006976]|uniref:RHS repeat-associated core domain-containing protein n=1 Tax=Streptomyces sp. NPDC006976 TaxID=3154311 RepID=UPI0033C2B14F